MELDRIQVALRPRTSWEGLDLGFALARHWFWPLWGLWWASALPLALLLLPLTGLRPDIWLLLLWWMKPLYEAPLLAWSSRALFGRVPVRGEVPGLLRAGWRRWMIPLLLWRRLGPRRAFLMPVALLEGLSGREARQRKRLLNAGDAAPTWLTLVAYHFELVLWGSVLFGVFLAVPSELPRLDLAEAVTDRESWAYWISVLAYLLAFSCIAPFYVCAGFALYLNRRTELEAWDLELAFRKGSASRPSRASLVRSAGVGLIALALLSALPAGPAESAVLEDPDAAQRLIQEVLESPDFGEEREIWTWGPIEKPDPEPEPPWISSERLEAIAVLMGHVLRAALMTLALMALILLAARILRDRRGGWLRRLSPPSAGPSPVRAALPPDLDLGRVPERVRAHLAEDDPRAALALLYRASLRHLAGLGLSIPEGATERECLALATRSLSVQSLGPVPRLVREWQALAYAHAGPTPGSVERLLDDWCRWIQSGPAVGETR
ncbi:DUF4129 domain-containing protein [Imhoffiella purpurea]|uniref:Protein-glutamine gamma-glutamyltransferase-like C-terminal domain-containing protein n=1 Tax=Imhoffiella purpurea TaxID=1249627 RepID=W9V232_9GAMM|nr:DUF4129 domain-containing protein [Imhoffiella purpurea]EXJ13359.1 hypothetical protein D779_3831 [Imhoffiella purpurea]